MSLKYFNKNVGVINTFINLQQQKNELTMTIPLCQLGGRIPFEFALIKNNFSENKDICLSLGFICNLYREFYFDGINIVVREADGVEKTFVNVGSYYECSDTLERIYTYYQNVNSGQVTGNHDIYESMDGQYSSVVFKDKQGLTFFYKSTSDIYPIKISMYDKELADDLYINYTGNKITKIYNDNENIQFDYSTGNKVSIYYSYGTKTQKTIHLNLSNNILTSVNYNGESTDSVGSYALDFFGDNVKITDIINQHKLEITKENGLFNSTAVYFGANEIERTSFTYHPNRTTVICNGLSSNVIFSDDGTKTYVIDQEGNIIGDEYEDLNCTRKVQDISVFNLNKNREYNLFDLNLETNGNGAVFEQPMRDLNYFDNVLQTSFRIEAYDDGDYVKFTKSDFNGSGLEPFRLVMFCRVLSGKGEDVEVKLSINGESTSRRFKNTTDCSFELMSLGLVPKENYDSIKIEFLFKDEVDIEIADIMMLQQEFGSQYEYDVNQNLVKVKQNGIINNYVYDDKNRLIKIEKVNGNNTTYHYDEYTKLITAITHENGLEVEKLYEDNKLIKETFADSEGLKTFYSYFYEDDKVYKITNALGTKEEIEYDNIFKNNISKYSGHLTERTYKYFNNGLIKKITQKVVDETYCDIDFIYYENNSLIKSVIVEDREYIFNYDSFGNVKNVQLDGNVLVEYDYYYDYSSKHCKLKNKKYSNSKIYSFEYDTYGRLKKVKYNNNLKYTYTYDLFGRVINILDEQNEIIYEYDYDVYGLVKKISSNNCEINYNTNTSIKNVENKKMLQTINGFVGEEKNKIAFLNNIRNSDKYYGTIFAENDESLCSKNEKIDLYRSLSVVSGLSEVFDNLPTLHTSTGYYANVTNTPTDLEQGSTAFWFYPTNNLKEYITSISNGRGNISLSVFKDTSGNVTVETDNNGTIETNVFSNAKIVKNKWNFIGVSFINTNYGMTYIMVIINGVVNFFTDQGISLGSGQKYNIGCKPNKNSNKLNAYITALIIGKRQCLTAKELMDYYRESKNFIYENKSSEISNKEFIFSDYMLDVPSGNAVIMLNDSFISSNNVKPSLYDRRVFTNTGLDKTFIFDKELKRQVLCLDGNSLVYNFALDNSGTIMARVKTDVEGIKRYIFELVNNSGEKIGLFIGEDNYLYLDYGSQQKTTLYFTPNEWHNVGIAFLTNDSSDSDAVTTTNSLRVLLNGSVYEKTIDFSELKIVKTSIGRRLNESTISSGLLGMYNTAYPLMGYMEMLVFNLSYSSTSSFSSINNKLKLTRCEYKFNDFGLVVNKVIKENESSIISHEYDFMRNTQGDSNIFLPYVNTEVIKLNNTTISRYYDTTGTGRLISITDSTFGNNTYRYDNLGRVSLADNKTIEYDEYGNITKKGINIYGYNSNIKDRLDTYNGMSLVYSSEYPFLLTAYDNKTFTYEGGKVIGINISYADEDEQISFKYNPYGLRTEKRKYYSYDDERESYEEIHKYYYEGDRLITEIAPTYRLDFLYDNNGDLYGLTYKNFNETNYTKYFYVRDAFKNIIGIVDSSGNLVVKYNQDAWGYPNSISDTSGLHIGSKNPFRYKGYYYDVETGLFWCNSRYYNPEWGRWISPDSIEYLNPQSINGLNLYAYCNNNPVMYSDPDGHMPQWLKWAIGGTIIAASIALTIATGGAAAGTIAAAVHTVATGAMIGGIASAAIGTVAGGITYDGERFGWDWDNAATGFMLGSITGTVSGAIGGVLDVGGIAAESLLSRGIMAGVDSALGLGSYFAQNAINHTMDNVSFMGAAISFAGGLFSLGTPTYKVFDAIWGPTMASEIAWVYDTIRVGIKNRR